AEKFESILETHLHKLIQDRLPPAFSDEIELNRSTRWFKGSPFRGLEAFDFEHAPIFFGRTQAIANIKDALVEQQVKGCAFLLVLGMSGGGKSSLVRAGVLPTLVQPGVIEGIGLWRWSIFRPSDTAGDLCEALATGILNQGALPELEQSGFDAVELTKLFREAPQRSVAPVRAALQRAAESTQAQEQLIGAPKTRLVLAIDQLEEIFTLERATAEERHLFMSAIDALTRSGLVWVIATMRSDFYPRCAELPQLVSLKEGSGQYDLIAPTLAEIGQMIRYPVRAAGLHFEIDIGTRMRLDDVLEEAASVNSRSLPLLEFTLDELFKRRTEEGLLTFAAYRSIGGLQGALALRAEEVFHGLSVEAQAVFPVLMRALVTLGVENDGTFTSRRVRLARVSTTPTLHSLVDSLVQARLLVTERSVEGEAVVSFAHEALFHAWPRLREWLAEDRDFLRTRARIEIAAVRWQQESKASDFLLPGGRPLAEAADLLARRRSDLHPELVDFIEKSIQANSLARQRELYFRNVPLAHSEWAANNVSRGLQLLAECPPALRGWEWYYVQRLCAGELLTIVAEDVVNGVSFSPDGSRIAAAVGDHRKGSSAVQIWDSDTGKEIFSFRVHSSPVSQLAFSKNGKCVASLSKEGGEVLFWNSDSGDVMFSIRKKGIRALAISPSGDTIAVAGESVREPDGKTRTEIALWKTSIGKEVAILSGVGSSLDALAFSPDGTRLAAGGGHLKKGEVTIWDLESRKELLSFVGHSSQVFAVAFSPDSQRVASGGYDNLVKVWNAQTGEQLFTLAGHNGTVSSVAFTPRGERIASGSWDHSLKVWDAFTGEEKFTLRGHNKWVSSVAFNADGGQIISGSRDKTVKLWDGSTGNQGVATMKEVDSVWITTLAFHPGGRRLAAAARIGEIVMVWRPSTGTPIGHFAGQNCVAYSPNGKRIAAGGTQQSSNVLIVWDTDNMKELLALRGHDGQVNAVAFSPNGDLVATASADATVRVWEANSGRGLMVLRGHTNAVSSLVFTPDGQYLVTASHDKTVRAWDVRAGSELRTFYGSNFPVLSLALSRDGLRVAAACGRYDEPGVIKVLNLSDGHEELTLAGHNDQVTGVAFSHDGRRIASSSFDQTIKFWDAGTGKELLMALRGHPREITAVCFSPDGHYLASADKDGTIKTWNATPLE
ncbi:MAG: hypothetical protein WCA38_07790, partial [Candidatus Acidiferrales bacterium]